MIYNYLDNSAQGISNLLGETFINYWMDYKAKKDSEANRDIPGFAELKVLLTHCLRAIDGESKYDKCSITSFVYSVLLECPEFVFRYQTFRRTALAKVDELLHDDYIMSGEHPIVQIILQQFKDRYRYDDNMNIVID